MPSLNKYYRLILKRLRHYRPDIYWRIGLRQKIILVLVSLILVCLGSMYGIARWYIYTQRNTPLTLGVSFIPDYAQYLGVDPKATLNDIFKDLGTKNVRLVSYWSDIEPTPGNFDFSTLDWEFAMANQYHAKISLSVGLRQPRWPECHPPSWVDTSKSESTWYPALQQYMSAVINRYKDNTALNSYELENEYFLKVFGTCQNYDRDRLINELGLIKSLDPKHSVIISRSNNAIGWPINAPTPDEFGVSVYKRVWDQTITHRYFEYPFPAWIYGFIGGISEIWSGKNMIIHELQAEPWPPNGILDSSLAEQDKSMNAARLKDRFSYGEGSGIKEIYAWGAEWWYWRKVKANDPSIWNMAITEFQNARNQNAKLIHSSYKSSNPNLAFLYKTK